MERLCAKVDNVAHKRVATPSELPPQHQRDACTATFTQCHNHATSKRRILKAIYSLLSQILVSIGFKATHALQSTTSHKERLLCRDYCLELRWLNS
jgi:hypothetical protein